MNWKRVASIGVAGLCTAIYGATALLCAGMAVLGALLGPEGALSWVLADGGIAATLAWLCWLNVQDLRRAARRPS